MKKVIYLLVLCMVLGMAGCGTNQENKEPVSGNVGSRKQYDGIRRQIKRYRI